MQDMFDDTGRIYVGPQLKRFREALGLTQQEMAEDLNLSQVTVHKIETNKLALDKKTIIFITKKYKDYTLLLEYRGAEDKYYIKSLMTL